MTPDRRAWLMQVLAPLTVRYGRELLLPGTRAPAPRRVRVPTRHGEVGGLLYRPAGSTRPPLHVHLHGGAFVMRHPRMDAFLAHFLVARAGIAVLLLDHDAAPQVRYPVAHEQAADALVHVAARGAALGVDPHRWSVGGFSSGGNLAASACLQVRDAGGPAPRCCVLGVPSLDVAEDHAAKRPVGTPMLGPEVLDLVRATYFRDATRRTEPRASPLRAPSLAGLPPTLVVTAERDLLRREGDAYAHRLAQEGTEVVHHVVRGRDHYFLGPDNVEAELGRVAAFLSHHLG
ncbi:acetyl esterase [Nocardioides scoriae]|uniref:Acetyl esterase n=1 Tax=Nocardioides scoriae TaxID=642780 RepID=A0A1H1Y491_9ACTN|nr:alpha/beta hydrolase [Nocardioides scoriae]SDT16253.1 acetyl esterase [Nocardioides scoriae]